MNHMQELTGDAIQEKVAAVWREILEAATVGVDESLIDLGGDSIAATMCAHRLQTEFGVRVPVSTLLDETTTVRSLSAHIRTASAVPQGQRAGASAVVSAN
jgi:acyl carrier protein